MSMDIFTALLLWRRTARTARVTSGAAAVAAGFVLAAHGAPRCHNLLNGARARQQAYR